MSPEPIPFRAALSPWLAAARDLLGHQLPEAETVLATPARVDLVEWLARDLADAASPTLLEGFLEHPGRRSMSSGSRTDYERYDRHLAVTAMRSELREHPELATVLDRVVDAWSSRVTALIRSLAAEAALVEGVFGARLPIRQAFPVGETVVGLGADAGAAVVYKGRAMDMDVAFGRLLRTLNRLVPDHPMAVRCMVDRGDHGWMAYVPRRPPAGRRTMAAYWHRVGKLLCIVHALGGGDIHAGNVRVDDDNPVIVDGEVLLRPRRARTEDGVPEVLSTGWLPTAAEAERCGLAAVPFDERTSRWIAPCTDGMRRVSMRSPLRAIRPAVVEEFDRLVADGGLDSLIRGFEAMYRLILEGGLPLDVFDGCRPRVLLRTSHLYQGAMERSLEPHALRSAQGREQVLRRLTRETPPALQGRGPAASRAVATVEYEAMAAGRVPRLTVPVDGRDLVWEGRSLGPVFTRSPRERAVAFIDSMHHGACRQQVHVINDVVRTAAADRQTSGGWQLRLAREVDLAAL